MLAMLDSITFFFSFLVFLLFFSFEAPSSLARSLLSPVAMASFSLSASSSSASFFFFLSFLLFLPPADAEVFSVSSWSEGMVLEYFKGTWYEVHV